MNDPIRSGVMEAEERLRRAMLGSDVDALDDLLAADLVFTNHLGRVFGKADDIGAHRSGIVTISELTPSEQRIEILGDVAVVIVRMGLSGTWGRTPASGDFRFTRVWAKGSDDAWRVVAAHSSVVA